MKMQSSEIRRRRLFNTGLSQSRYKNAAGAVLHLGAVQAQDFAAAKWSLGLRVKKFTGGDIQSEYDRGDILRVHVLRPTWHFVLPEDIGWMIEMTAPRIKTAMAAANRKLELDQSLISRSNNAVVKALQDHRYLTRPELKAVLAAAGIQTNVQRLAHILMLAELDRLICSGPQRGKQLTYALLEERALNMRRLVREEALALLASRYFSGHGPAQSEDFAWWSGLAAKDAREALDSIKTTLTSVKLNNKTYWHSEHTDTDLPGSPPAILLPIYDEYVIAYQDRSDISQGKDIERMITKGNLFTSVIILRGEVAGAWSKSVRNNSVEIKLTPFRQLTEREKSALQSEIERYGQFSGLTAVRIE
jgi:hypothetical protein